MHDAASWGIAGVDFDVVHYGVAREKMFWLLLQWLKPPSDGNLLKGRLWISVWFMQLTVLGLLTYYTRLHKSSLLDLRVSRLIVGEFSFST
ncbi:hypothetical protein HanHA300_Chr05g0159011 [Helianthus annuus]|nr:hypothetical protein HanHA300_Chr05g0159011 [Helianthus annuus]